jgi:tetratricopeptide (TPR) repeat protein
MASHKISKREMKEDQFRDFLSEFYWGILQHIQMNWRAYLIGLGVILLAGAGGYYLWFRGEAKNEEASYLLSQVMEAYNAPVEKEKQDPNSVQLTFATESAKNQEIKTRLTALQAKAGKDGPKGLGTIYGALDQARAGKSSEAIATITPLTKGSDLSPLALSLRAGLYESAGQNDKAEADWKSLAEYKGSGWPDGEGWYSLGQYYERRSQNEKALEAYKKAEASFAGEKADEDPLVKRAKDKIEALKGKA